MAKMTIVRLLLAADAGRQCPFYQLDVTNTFLHGDLSEEVYMAHPHGPTHSPFVGFVRLSTASSSLPEHGLSVFVVLFLPLTLLKALMTMHFSFARLLDHILLLYVDGMVISGDDVAGTIISLKQHLQQEFQKKDLSSSLLYGP